MGRNQLKFNYTYNPHAQKPTCSKTHKNFLLLTLILICGACFSSLMGSKAKESRKPLEEKEARKIFSPGVSRRKQPCGLPDLSLLVSFWTSNPHSHRRINFCYFEPLNLWYYVTMSITNK